MRSKRNIKGNGSEHSEMEVEIEVGIVEWKRNFVRNRRSRRGNRSWNCEMEVEIEQEACLAKWKWKENYWEMQNIIAKLQSCNRCRIRTRSLLWILTCACSLVCPQWALMRKTATRCNALHHTAPHSTILNHNVTHYYTLQHTATHHAAVHNTNNWPWIDIHADTPQHTATHCNTAPRSNTLQYNATHWIETLANTPAALHISPSRYTVRERAPCRPYVRWAPVSRTQQPCHFTAVQHSATQCNTVQHSATHLTPLLWQCAQRSSQSVQELHESLPLPTVMQIQG